MLSVLRLWFSLEGSFRDSCGCFLVRCYRAGGAPPIHPRLASAHTAEAALAFCSFVQLFVSAVSASSSRVIEFDALKLIAEVVKFHS